jgi:hypothetical protein
MRQQRLFLYYDFKSCAIQPVEATLGDGQAIWVEANRGLTRWFRLRATPQASREYCLSPAQRLRRFSVSPFALCSHGLIVPQLISLICAASKV